jgi:dethiobiotin synthetase
MHAFFITGTHIDVGKTFLSCALLRHWRAQGRKVDAFRGVITGDDPTQPQRSDAGLLLQALGQPVDTANLDRICPWRYRAALAPDAAAEKEGDLIDYRDVVSSSRAFLRGVADLALIEGLGGVMAPLTEDRTMLDWIADVQLPAVLVTGSYLGTLSHSLTALQVLADRGVPVRLIVMSETTGSSVPLAENAVGLARRWPAAPVRALPRDPSPQAIAAIADELVSDALSASMS